MIMRYTVLKMLFYFLLATGVFFFTPASAQTKRVAIKFGDVKAEDFAPTVYSVDSSADAVYLFDGGKTEFTLNEMGYYVYFSYIYTHHARIRLLKKTSFQKLGTVDLQLANHPYNTSDDEKLIDFRAAVYNITDGKVTSLESSKNDLMEENVVKSKHYNMVSTKYTFPNLSEGCIIEYTYTIEYPNISYLHSWKFQGNYPKLWSEYEFTRPQAFIYLTTKYGYLKFDIDSIENTYTNYAAKDKDKLMTGNIATSTSTATFTHVWAVKDVPAIKEQPFITSLSNYTSRVEFQLYNHRWDKGVLQSIP